VTEQERISNVRTDLLTKSGFSITSEQAKSLIEVIEGTMVENDILKEAIQAIKAIDNTQYDTKRFVVVTEDDLLNRPWWLREPIVHETMTVTADCYSTCERMQHLRNYGQSQAFLIVPVDLKKHMETE